MTGTLYGVGVGPGDPELVTLKAARLIAAASVIAYPAPDSGVGFARSIVADLIPENAREIPMLVPMRPERFAANAVYAGVAETIADHLRGGTDVVTLCEGDPFFYGSFMYLHIRLADRFPVVVVPGVASLGAVTAASGRPLCARAEGVTVLPATMTEERLEARLAAAEAAAVMKLGRHFAKARRVIDRLDLTDRATFVSHASLPNQKVAPLAEAPATAPYFSMIVIPGRDVHA